MKGKILTDIKDLCGVNSCLKETGLDILQNVYSVFITKSMKGILATAPHSLREDCSFGTAAQTTTNVAGAERKQLTTVFCLTELK